MFWLRNKKIIFLLRTLNSSPGGHHSVSFLNPFVSGNPLNGYFANSLDPDEMQHNAAFNQGLHCYD